MKLKTFTEVRMINPINLDKPVMHDMVLISLEIVMKQCPLYVNLILVILCHLHSLGNATLTDNLATILLPTVTLLMDTEINHCSKPNLQLSVLTNKPDQMAELSEATRKMMKYFKM